MELKNYQKKVIGDLTHYMELLNELGSLGRTWRAFWEEKNVPIGFGGVPAYQDILPEVPNLCFKVPTGGGKTFLACNAIKPIFDALPLTKSKAVVWLVPSEAILSQTLAALKNTSHPYRQKIDEEFGSRVEIYTKQEMLNGQNFNITAVSEQLSIMVLSYDSFRGRKEALKARQENSNLAPMARALGTPAYPIENADETALLQVINQLSPLVIVDESHHARSKLSKEMLRNFNPCFVLDLTATPTTESNILCYVDAVQLKRESMVKLPVIVYNRNSQQEVLADAIDMRNRLEQYAVEEEKKGGMPIRPIVLFQAQSKGKENSTTFERLREKLVDAGIPEKEIAIKTADVNELKNIDLMDPGCPIRYIITVNALKEGWDCPFAYILASLANKTSQIDVEQIVGRVLRQPFTKRSGRAELNMCYVLTNSNDFKSTLDDIVKGLNGAGFSEKECRAQELTESPVQEQDYIQGKLFKDEAAPYGQTEGAESFFIQEEFLDFDSEALKQDIHSRLESLQTSFDSGVGAMFLQAEKEHRALESMLLKETGEDIGDIPGEVREKMRTFQIKPEFREEVSGMKLPQFFRKVENSFFIDGYEVILKRENLGERFTLKGKPYAIAFDRIDDEMARVDIEDAEGSVPRVFKMSEADQRFIKQEFFKYTPEQKIRVSKERILKLLDRMDMVDAEELRNYVDLIVSQMDRETLAALEKSPQGFAVRIKKYIEGLLDIHYEHQFREWIETGEIVCRPSYQFPAVIAPFRATTTFGGSLYEGEEEVNGLEYDMVMALTALPNIKWWHRNISKQGFVINGFINHYPDFIVRTKKDHTILIETKGEHLDNEQNRKKLALSRIWQNKAGEEYRYYMVFRNKSIAPEGAYSIEEFLKIIKRL